MSFSVNMKTIVVATDLEGRSEAALEYARKLAAAYGARIVLAHGLDPMDYAAVEAVPGKILRRMPETARAVLDEMAADLVREGIHSHSEVRQGAVVDMLLDVIRQYEAGLVVVGTRGGGGAGPVAVGAIAEALVRRAPCPVLAVAADWNAGAYRPVPGGPVLLAMERNDSMRAAVETAISLAEKFQRTLIVVHARTAAEASAFLNPCATTLEELGIRDSGALAVRCVVKDGQPADAIPRAIAQFSPSMLVLGVKRHSDTPGRHGTVFSLLAGSRVPVLCVPAEAIAEHVAAEADVAVEIG
ncbi:MAG TPA: universal stress protein [Terracidiphilus sp.]|jgi:nucleotide-binding universal stress UspA family protein|nr:universal stress protein [Terracidiphilus sp.]